MASLVNAALCALVATAFWSLPGYALARHLLPRPLAMGAAPVLGWAVLSAVTLPAFYLIGFSPVAVIGVAALCVVASGLSLFRPSLEIDAGQAPPVPAWAIAAAALLALVPAAAIVPKFSGAGVSVADAIFDHSKIAIIDAMTRQGLPPINPIFGEAGAASRLGLLLSLALQRRRAGAAAARERLGSRYRPNLVHGLCVAHPDDGARGLAQQRCARGDPRRRASRRGPRCAACSAGYRARTS